MHTNNMLFAKRVTWVATVLLAMSLVVTVSANALKKVEQNNHANYAARVATHKFPDKIETHAEKVERFLTTFADLDPHQICMLLDDSSRLWASSNRDELSFGKNGERPGMDMSDAGNRMHSTTHPIKKLVSLSKTDTDTSEIMYIEGRTYVSHAVALSGNMVLICASSIS